jgi:N-acetylmuramoyl-L-alanine amidase
MAAPLIAVDAGHYPDKPGVIAPTGRSELEYNLALAADVASALEREGLSVRKIGQHPGFGARTREAKGAVLFLSIHHDSVRERYISEPQLFSGFSLYVSRLNRELERSERCASAIGARLRGIGLMPSRYHADAVFGENRPFADAANGVHYFDNLAVGKSAGMAAVLVEAGVIVNAEEERRITEPAMRRDIAGAIARGAADCLR